MQGNIVRLQTVHTFAEGVAPAAREAASSARIRAIRPSDIPIEIPKGGHEIHFFFATPGDIAPALHSMHESGSGSKTYMVSYRETKNVLYSLDCEDGRRLWALRDEGNEATTLFTAAGLWTTGSLLSGTICTLHETPVAQRLMRGFLSALKTERFTKIDVWWLSPEAVAMLKAGKRLTQAEQAPRECDLGWPTRNAEQVDSGSVR